MISGDSGLWPTRDAIRAFRYCMRVTWQREGTVSLTHTHTHTTLTHDTHTQILTQTHPHPYELQVGEGTDGVVRTVAGRAGGISQLKRILGRTTLGRHWRLVHWTHIQVHQTNAHACTHTHDSVALKFTGISRDTTPVSAHFVLPCQTVPPH